MVGVTTTNANGISHQQYIYDASGDRVASIADGVRTNYLVDPMRGVSQVLLEYDANGQVTAEYTYGLGLIKSDRSGTENYYHTDGLGSTRVLTNSTGQVVDNYTYDAYGRLLSSTGTSSNSYQFAGEQRDSQTGLDYLRARYYDADLGRFISKDSFAGFMDDPMSQHNYLYANANPVNFIDPTGHETMGDIGAVLSIIGSLAAAVGVGAGAGYLTGSALNGASGEDLLNLTDQWVAGFANTVSFGASTQIRRSLYGEIAEQNHSGFMWNMGQVAGTGVAMILGAATPENLTFSMGRSNWIATTYDAIGTGVGAWQTGTHIREGQLEWSDAFNLLPFVPFATRGTKQFFGTAIDVNERLRGWGQMGVSTSFDGWLAAGNKGGFRRNLAASRTNNFRNNSTVFYHGTSSEFAGSIRSTGINLSYGRPNADFGSGFYISNQRDTALWSASRLYGNNVDIINFRVSNQQLNKLDHLTFDSPSGDWADFVRFHKTLEPIDLMHGGQTFDMVTGPLFKRFTSNGEILDHTGRIQTNIHTQQAANLFNGSIR